MGFQLQYLFIIGALGATRAMDEAYKHPIMALSDYKGALVWHSRGSGAEKDFSCFSSNFVDGLSLYALGHHGQANYHSTVDTRIIAVKMNEKSDDGALIAPISFKQIWNDVGYKTSLDGTVVRPVCPSGYVSLGDVMFRSHGAPPPDLYTKVRCLKETYAVHCEFGNIIWSDHGSTTNKELKIYSVRCRDNDALQTDFFYASSNHKSPPTVIAYGIRSSSIFFF